MLEACERCQTVSIRGLALGSPGTGRSRDRTTFCSQQMPPGTGLAPEKIRGERLASGVVLGAECPHQGSSQKAAHSDPSRSEAEHGFSRVMTRAPVHTIRSMNRAAG